LPEYNPDTNATTGYAADLYYEDINGTWADSNGDGLMDSHTGSVAPEIFVSHILTSNLTSLHAGRTEAAMLNNYFAKDHAYRLGQLRTPQNSLFYSDDLWAPYQNYNAYTLLGPCRTIAHRTGLMWVWLSIKPLRDSQRNDY